MMNLPVIFLVLYFAVILLTARLFARRIRNLQDYFLAGRSLGSWPVAFSFAAAWFGAASTMGSINAFHDQGLSGAWMLVLPSVLSFVVITFGMARPVAKQRFLSQPEAVEAYYGRFGRLLLAIVILCAGTTLIGSQMVAAGQIFQNVFGLDITWATVLSTAAVVSYAMWGGYFTVVVTDIAQVVFILLGFVILLAFSWGRAVPDAAAWQAFVSHQPPHFWEFTHGWRENIFLVFTFVLGWCIAPEMWQRMSSTRSPDLAFHAGWQATLILTSLFALIVSIGLLSARIIGHSDAVLVALARAIPNQTLGMLVLLGFLAAVTSTMDSTMNVGSLTLTRDIYQGFLRPQASTQELLWVGRLSTALMVVPAMIIALHFQDIIRILWISADIYASCMFFPIVGLLHLKRPGRWSGIQVMAFGGASVLFSALAQNHLIPNPFHWPGWPYSTLLSVGLSGLGFGLGHSLSQPNAALEAPILPEAA
jgi:SSS family solute:Na+ symporter